MKRERKSPRRKNWDYTTNGLYFITICTKDRTHYFGEIQNGELIFTPCGAIADILWAELKHRNKNLSLGEFVVMPNHIHGIIQLENTELDENNIIEGENMNQNSQIPSTDVARNVPTVPTTKDSQDIPKNNPSNFSIKNEKMASISPKANSISTIIRSYKSAVTKHCNRLKLDFAWQSRYHDHIIRNDKSFQRISEYIINNPKNWKEDGFRNKNGT